MRAEWLRKTGDGLFVSWVYLKSLFYTLKNVFKKNNGTDPFIYK